MYCSQCGTTCGEEDKVCTKCGNQLAQQAQIITPELVVPAKHPMPRVAIPTLIIGAVAAVALLVWLSFPTILLKTAPDTYADRVFDNTLKNIAASMPTETKTSVLDADIIRTFMGIENFSIDGSTSDFSAGLSVIAEKTNKRIYGDLDINASENSQIDFAVTQDTSYIAFPGLTANAYKAANSEMGAELSESILASLFEIPADFKLDTASFFEDSAENPHSAEATQLAAEAAKLLENYWRGLEFTENKNVAVPAQLTGKHVALTANIDTVAFKAMLREILALIKNSTMIDVIINEYNALPADDEYLYEPHTFNKDAEFAKIEKSIDELDITAFSITMFSSGEEAHAFLVEANVHGAAISAVMGLNSDKDIVESSFSNIDVTYMGKTYSVKSDCAKTEDGYIVHADINGEGETGTLDFTLAGNKYNLNLIMDAENSISIIGTYQSTETREFATVEKVTIKDNGQITDLQGVLTFSVEALEQSSFDTYGFDKATSIKELSYEELEAVFLRISDLFQSVSVGTIGSSVGY